MKYHRIALCLLALTAIAAGARSDRAPLARRWFYLNANHHGQDAERIDADIVVLKRAAACGYNGVVFEDLDLGLLDRMPATYVPNVQRFVAAAARAGVEIVPQVAVPYGERVLRHDPNLAEGLRVDGALFVVHGNRLDLQPDRPRVTGGAARVFPHRVYRVTAMSPVRVTDTSGHPLAYANPAAMEVLFNSRDHRQVRVEGEGATVEEAGPVNILRRPGTPLEFKTSDSRLLEEDRDYLRVVDPAIEAVRQTARYNAAHAAPEIRLGPDSRLREGDHVRGSWYHAALVNQEGIDQAFACLSEPELYRIWQRQIEDVERVFHPRGYLIGHDELRAANSCRACADLHRTAGEAVAESARRAIAFIRQANPRATVYAWSDMFDPYENAVARYYLVEGSLAGGWNGLDRSVEILNWSDDIRSVRWFKSRGHGQAVAGFYDGDGPKTADWLPRVQSIAPVTGVMYTTWKSDYTQLEAFAATLWGGGRR